MSGSIFLGGGGSENDERLLWDEVFVPGQRVVVWPYATRDRDARRRVGAWVAGSLAERGDFEVEVWLDEDRDIGELDTADVLAIPGGNTFDLLALLQRTGWLPAVPRMIARGGRVYGGSAGAVLLGADIALAAFADPNDAGVTDTRGLDLLSGCVVYPHYHPEAASDAAGWAHRLGATLIGIPENAGVAIAGATATNAGPADVAVFGPGGDVRVHRPGRVWDLAG